MSAARTGLLPRRLLAAHREEILDLARARGASNVRVFGSVARGEDDARSDIDLLVDFPAGTSLLAVIGLENALRDLLGVPVDVGPADALRSDMRERVLSEARVVSRIPIDRLRDIEEAIAAIRRFERAGRDDPMVFDAVRMRLLEIGEAAGGIPAGLRASEPDIPWREIIGMRNCVRLPSSTRWPGGIRWRCRIRSWLRLADSGAVRVTMVHDP